MKYPNKIFYVDRTLDYTFKTRNIIIIAAKDKETANNHLRKKFNPNIDYNPVMLSNAAYKTIWDRTGKHPEIEQAKILFHISYKL